MNEAIDLAEALGDHLVGKFEAAVGPSIHDRFTDSRGDPVLSNAERRDRRNEAANRGRRRKRFEEINALLRGCKAT